MKLIGKFELQDPFGNKKTLSISTDRENGHVSYRLVNNHTSFAISNMQCGWRGPVHVLAMLPILKNKCSNLK